MGNKTKTKYESYWNEHEFESSVLAWIQVKLITITNKKIFSTKYPHPIHIKHNATAGFR